jgi:hypothetical protein
LFTERSCPTDDSLLTWAVAETILRGERDYKPRLVGMLGYYEKNGQHAPLPAAFGGGFSSWVYDGAPGERNSSGNGSAMRVSPAAWAFDDLETVLEHATLSARPSHAHPEGIKGAQAVAAAIWTARKYRNPAAVRAVAENFSGPLPRTRPSGRPMPMTRPAKGACRMPGHRRRHRRLPVRRPLRRLHPAGTPTPWPPSPARSARPSGPAQAHPEQSLAVAARCYPGLERTVAEFEARFGGY